MTTTKLRTALDDVLGDWHLVRAPHPTFRTYRDATARWWAVLGLTGDDAGKFRITRTDETGRLAEPFNSDTAWVKTDAENLRELLAASGAPDIEVLP